MQNRFGRSKLELRGPRNDLIGRVWRYFARRIRKRRRKVQTGAPEALFGGRGRHHRNSPLRKAKSCRRMPFDP
eukprot:1075578-Alexandrium_andersonii.AAC.1